MRKLYGLLLALIVLLSANLVNAQMVIDNTQTPQQLVQDVLLGQGVVVSNITFTGGAEQIGYFDATNANFPIPEGIVLSTGDVADVPGTGGTFASTIVGNPGDPDLDIVEPAGTNDAVALTFDFVPTGDSIRFDYIFGSEEYPEFVNSGFNDAFVFTISGPGFNGPFANGGENIALIPGTVTPVTIDNLNAGLNNQYYIDNNNGTDPDGVVYDGYTVTLTALAEVQCGETYTLKFVIGDGGDSSFDSGVFLEARSFSSNAVNINISTASGNIEDGGGWIVEGCTPAEIIFERPANAVDTAIAVPILIEGNAINGVDYTGIPDTAFFAIGDTSITFVLEALDDNLVEFNDSIIITVFSLNLCGDTIVSTGTIFIRDEGSYTYDLAASGVTSVECAGDSVLLTAEAVLGNPEYTFVWSNGLQGDSIWITPIGDTTLTLNSVDACGVNGVPDAITVNYNVNPNPVANISGPTTFDCAPETISLTANGSAGNGPYVFIWNTGAGSSTINPTVTSDTLFSVTAIDQCGVSSPPDTVYITQNPVAIPTIQTSLDVVLDCPGEVATLTAIASGGAQPYTYLWSETGETSSTINVQPAQTTEYVVTVEDDCYEGSVTATILVTVEPYVEPTVTIADTTVQCVGDVVTLDAVISDGNDPFDYSWTTGSNGSSSTFNADVTSTVTVSVEDNCGTVISADAEVTVPTYQDLAVSLLDTLTICEVWSDTIGAAVSGGLPPYSYSWSGTFVEGSMTNDSAMITIPFELEPDTTIYAVHSVSVTDQCLENVQADVLVEAISCDVIQPSIFNPESDFTSSTDICGNVPQNNVFNLPCLNLYPGNNMLIMDRWGRKVYEVENYHLAPWDGGNSSSGTYFYVCELPGDKEAVKGYFQLVR